MRRVKLLVGCLLAVAVGVFVVAQEPSGGWITDIDVVGLSPFDVSFGFENRGGSGIRIDRGTVRLTDRLGAGIEQIALNGFDAAPGERVAVGVQSRWEFQITGIYLLDISLETSDGHLISKSLAFRIIPIGLPLAPATHLEGEGLYTVQQQPASWGLDHIGARDVWWVTHGSRDVVVAVIDSGIDFSVPQLADAQWTNPGEIANNGRDDDGNGFIDDVHGYDFRDNDAGSHVGTPIHSHGTFVASIIAARPGPLPIVGVAPGIRLMDVRFLDSSNSFRSSDWGAFARAVTYAADNGADIINLSIYANGRPPRVFSDALEYAASEGVIIVGIAGNEGRDSVMYPGKYDVVVAVSATTPDDLLASFSNSGQEIVVCAPGERITSIAAGGRAVTQSGTSFAAPHVSGVLALILSVAPNLSSSEAIELLARTAIDLGVRGVDAQFGKGLVDARAAVNAVME